MATDDDITTARLNGTARRLTEQRVDQETAVAEIHTISTSPDLLGRAAGTALASWRRDEIIGHGGDRIAELLTAAGADQAVLEQTAAETGARLAVTSRTAGIGNPGPRA